MQTKEEELTEEETKTQSDSRKSRKKKKLPTQYGIWQPVKSPRIWVDPPHIFGIDATLLEKYFHQEEEETIQ